MNKNVFNMPKPVTIMGRSSSITNESTELCLFNYRNKMKSFINNNLVEVSNLGRIKINHVLINQFQKKFGYLFVNLEESFDYPVYRFVGEIFCKCPVKNTIIHPKGEYWVVHHLTNNGFDNRANNLIWMIRSDHSKLKHPYHNLEIKKEIRVNLEREKISREEKLKFLDDLVAINMDIDFIKYIIKKEKINIMDYPFLFWNLKNT